MCMYMCICISMYIYAYLCIYIHIYIYIHVCVCVCLFLLSNSGSTRVPDFDLYPCIHIYLWDNPNHFPGQVMGSLVSRHRDIFWHCVHLLSPVLILSKSPKLGQHLQPEATLWLARIYAYVCASVQIMQSLIKELLQQAGYSSISPSQKIQKCWRR